MIASLFPEFLAPTPLQVLKGLPGQGHRRVFMKREDLRDPELGGNKWCKLAGHLSAARASGHTRLISVGGAWSNHLHALALAGRRFGFSTVGLVRGEPVMTPTLQDAIDAGMKVQFVSRENYRQRNSEEGLAELARPYGPAWLIPEGGGGLAGHAGVAHLATELEQQVHGDVLLAVPVGSGTTFAGLIKALPSRFQVWGFQAFHDDTLASRIAGQLPEKHVGAGWKLHQTPGMRSHRRLPALLENQLNSFEAEQGIALDPVYTVRMMTALGQLFESQIIPESYTVLALHTGGLQGRRGHGLVKAA